jgi:flagellar biogenesis protein FliO
MTTFCMRPILLVAIAAGLVIAPAEAAPFGGGQEIQIPFVRMLAAFAICALAALVLALFIKAVWLKKSSNAPRFRFFPTALQSSPKILNVLETRALSPQASLSRISYDDLEFLILVSAQGATVLHQKPIAISAGAENPT